MGHKAANMHQALAPDCFSASRQTFGQHEETVWTQASVPYCLQFLSISSDLYLKEQLAIASGVNGHKST